MSLFSRRPPRFSIFQFSLFALFFGVFGLAAFGQQPKVLGPHKPVAPRVPESKTPPLAPMQSQTASGGLWMIGTNFKALLYLSSSLKTAPLIVTPAVYLANGARYAFTPVTVEASGSAIVDIGQELAKQGIAPYATLSGYAEIQYQWPWAPICASVRDVDVVHSLTYIFGLEAAVDEHDAATTAAAQPQLLEGMWWKQEANVSGFVGLSNITSRPIDATLRIADAANNNMGSHVVTVSPNGTKIVELTELLSASSSEGGLALAYDGPKHGLVVNAGLQDGATGYSAHLPLLPYSPPPAPGTGASPAPSQISYAHLGLMTGAADPMMNFPAGTIFTPYAVVRNISDQPAFATPTFWWMAGGAAQSSQLPQITIPPHTTQRLNVPSFLVKAGLKNFNGNVNLVLDTQSQSRGLLIATGSVDQTNNYVFEVIPHGIVESVSKSLAYWSTGNGDDTMVTVWNPADEPQDFVFTLFYTGGHYAYPIQLGPRATQTFNISELLHTGIPDAEGNVLPAGIHEGSAEISGPQGENEHILVSMDTGVYNVLKAICGVYCQTCNGVVGPPSVLANPWSVGVGSTTYLTMSVPYNTGYNYDVSTHSNWSSSNASVATASNYGLVRGVAVGTATVSASDFVGEPPYISNFCSQPPVICPIGVFPSGGAPGGGCDFFITPGFPPPTDITAKYCDSLTENQRNFSVTLTSGSPSSCTLNTFRTACGSSGSTHVEIDESKTAWYTTAGLCEMYYWAGPGVSRQDVGPYTTVIDVKYYQNSSVVEHEVSGDVICQ